MEWEHNLAESSIQEPSIQEPQLENKNWIFNYDEDEQIFKDDTPVAANWNEMIESVEEPETEIWKDENLFADMFDDLNIEE